MAEVIRGALDGYWDRQADPDAALAAAFEAGMRLPDALIAATAIEHELSLFTRNRSDFEKVRGLQIREIR